MTETAPAIFIADSPGLDFLNSLATPVDVPVDWIADGAGFIGWLRQSGLVAPDILDEIADRAMPGELDSIADQARDLREWFRSFVRGHMGQPLGPDGLQELYPLNRLLERDETYRQVKVHREDDGHRHFSLETVRRWRSAETLLIPVGEAMAKAVAEEDFVHVKACEGPTCTLLFADHTRGHARRWCSMSACGNRAKVAAYRQRKRGHQSSPMG